MNEKPLENENPSVHMRLDDKVFTEADFKTENLPIDAREVFDHIRDIKDPEHPMTLEELNVVGLDLIEPNSHLSHIVLYILTAEVAKLNCEKINDASNYCVVQFVPTIPQCSMATLIGLAIKVQLLRLLPARFKIDVFVVPGTHNSCDAINKQLADKERITAALENVYLHEVINDCLLYPEAQTLPKFVEETLRKTDKLENPKVIYIQYSRQHIENYRRWRDIIYEDEKKWKSSLVYHI